MSPSQEDAELVRRFKAGDEGAFEKIVLKHRGTIFAIAVSVIRNRADAEEIASDTFIRAHRGLANFRGDSSLKTWLHRVTVNLARNRYWYFFRRRRHVTMSMDFPVGENSEQTIADFIPSDAPTPTQQIEHDEIESRSTRMMAHLRPHHREILMLRIEQHKDYAEIATILGIPVGSVKSRIARARHALSAKIADTPLKKAS